MNITQDLLFITQKEVHSFFSNQLDNAFHEIKKVYLAHAKGKAINPPSSFLCYDKETHSRAIALPAFIEYEIYKSVGIKWVSSCPQNIKHALPRASALIILNDYQTGFPLAVLEGATISALRTVLSAIIATEHLYKNKTINCLGIIGCGVIATNYIQCMQILGYKINSIILYDIDPKRAKIFSETLNQYSKIGNSINEVTQESSLLLLTTTVVTPYLHQTKIFQKNATILNLSLRDIAPNVILDAFNIVDDIEHVLNANTSPHLAFLSCGHKNFIHGTLSDLIEERCIINHDSLKIFSPMGMGVLDIALANLVYQYYNQLNQTNCVKNFFGD